MGYFCIVANENTLTYQKIPHPAKDGETIAIMQLLKGLVAAHHEVIE